MANGARFRITGSVSGAHSSSTPGATVTAGETLTLQLEDTASNILNAKYEIVEDSAAAAPALTLNPADGVPTPSATSAVTLVVPLTGPWSYKIRCTANRRYDANGTLIYDWMFERIIAIEPQGLRHILPSEVGEFDPVYTWVQAFNEMTNAVGNIDIDNADVFYFDDPDYGGVGDGQTVSNGATTLNDNTLTSASNPFVASDVGKIIRVKNAGAAGADLFTTIASFTSAGSIELTDAAGATIAGTAVVDWGTNNGASLQSLMDVVKANGGGIIQFGVGTYLVDRNMGLSNATGVVFRGYGMGTSIIKDARADDAVGAPTGIYYGLIFLKNCTDCGGIDLGLVGPVEFADLDGSMTAQGGRKAVFSWEGIRNFWIRCSTSYFRDEQFYAQGVSEQWRVQDCDIHHNNSNAINLNGGPTGGDGFVVAYNQVHDCRGGICMNGRSGFIIGNEIFNVLPAMGAGDALGCDIFCRCVIAFNIIRGITYTTSSAPISVFGTSDVNGSVLIHGNIVTECIGAWDVGAPGGAICVYYVAGVSQRPTGVFTITNNMISNCEGNDDADHCAIRLTGLGSTARAYIDGNTIDCSDAKYLRTAIRIVSSQAGADVLIGSNYMPGVVKPYDIDSSVRFNEACYVSSVSIDHTDSPYAVLPSTARVCVDCSGGAVQVNLPPCSVSEGREIQILDSAGAAAAHNITVDADGMDTINGAASVVSTTARQPITVYCVGGVWITTAPVF